MPRIITSVVLLAKKKLFNNKTQNVNIAKSHISWQNTGIFSI